MILHVLRAAFLLLMLSVAMVYIAGPTDELFGSKLLGYHREAVLLAAVGLALIIVAVDMMIPQKSLMAISGLFFGLIVGLVVTYGLCMVIDLLIDVTVGEKVDAKMVKVVKLILGVTSCYLAVSFVIQTKDDVRFVIPYVEFSKQIKGTQPMILDTSVIIDGRIADIAETRILGAPLIVPRFVLNELHQVADSGDRLKRARGRRGLDVLKALQASQAVEVQIHEGSAATDRLGESVDHKLLALAKDLDGRVVTNDYNLNKIAQVRHVDVININDLANAVKPIVLPGETMHVRVIKPGEEHGQGVGYLDDGTMVVIEQSADRIGEEIDIVITSALQTSAGRMIFGRPEGTAPPDRPRRRPRGTA